MSHPGRGRRAGRAGWVIGSPIALALLVLAARRTVVVVRVKGSSMLPTYADGERLLAVRPALVRAICRGDVLVVRAALPTGAADVLVKRVRAVGGDPLPGGAAGVLVPRGAYFVQGDGGASYDSRAFGVVGRRDVVARVVRALGPS